MSTVHVVVPDGIDDPQRPSGGNVYDREVCRGLTEIGWDVCEHAVAGGWPRPDASAQGALARVISDIPDDAVVLVDGLIASSTPDVLVPQAKRLRIVVLVHLPLGDAASAREVAEARTAESAVLSGARAVVTTSVWTRDRLLDLYELSNVHVAEPGVHPAALAPGSQSGGALLCVAAVAAHKGHDVLLAALTRVADLPWRCVCVGTLNRDPAYVERLRHQALVGGISERVCFTGALTGEQLDRAYAGADALVLASHGESYGMVVTEALARGLPVVATDVGGVPEALGRTSEGQLPGLLVPPGDATALAEALGAWLLDAELREQLRAAAHERRSGLWGWSVTVDRVASVLAEAAA